MKLKRIDNIDVLCLDLEPMVAFYRDVLGLEFRLPYDRSEGWAGFSAGNLDIYLIESSDGTHPGPRSAANEGAPAGFDSFAFEVDDLDEAIAHFDRLGVRWAGDVVESEWYAYRGMHDPEGNLVYVTVPKLDR
ncbi:VOC family protein [Patulibacter defluvii]|uniref:VOC family protein n=1 Tax=Patulibacter defluvii TaxID=3095358 RepID=UPI002A752621|nr:VOC family protein [Patulibacter sp. DM4]